MNETVYLKAPQCTEVQQPEVLLKDCMKLHTTDPKLRDKLNSLPVWTFQKGQKGQVVISILKVIEKIQKYAPDLQISNLGEGDFILQYEPPDKLARAKEILFTLLICLIAFFGGGYAIMAYNTDVGAKELFTFLSMLFLGNAQTGVVYLSISYAVGLTIGMLLFFNHLGSHRLTEDPSPLEVQMRLYEKDLSTTIIKDMSRRGESVDVR